MRKRIKLSPRITNDPDYKYAKRLADIHKINITRALQLLRKYDSINQASIAIAIDKQVQQLKTT